MHGDVTLPKKPVSLNPGGSNHAVRHYYLDWLRLFAIFVVFLHHCSKLFDYHTTTVYNTVRSPALSAFREFNFLWIMPLFFFISGASVCFSLRSRKAGGFLKERTLRILIPLVFIGTFVINPPYIYAWRRFAGQTTEGFFRWYPHYFDGIFPTGNFGPLGLGTHLWYLQYLFVYSLILLPLFIPWGKTGKSGLSKLSAFFEKPWALFLLFVPISAAAAGFELLGLGGMRVVGGWDPLSFLLFFTYGYLVYSNAQLLETIRRCDTAALIAAVSLTLFYMDSHFGLHLDIPGVTRHNIHDAGAVLPMDHSVWAAVQAFRGLLGWLWLIGLLGMGSRFLNFSNKFLSYGGEAVLPFYILHHSVILVIGLPVILWDWGISVKFFAVAVISFIVIMAIYEVLVRRLNVLRFLFGMKPLIKR
jgi:glucans biosynthesis protein C